MLSLQGHIIQFNTPTKQVMHAARDLNQPRPLLKNRENNTTINFGEYAKINILHMSHHNYIKIIVVRPYRLVCICLSVRYRRSAETI